MNRYQQLAALFGSYTPTPKRRERRPSHSDVVPSSGAPLESQVVHLPKLDALPANDR